MHKQNSYIIKIILHLFDDTLSWITRTRSLFIAIVQIRILLHCSYYTASTFWIHIAEDYTKNPNLMTQNRTQKAHESCQHNNGKPFHEHFFHSSQWKIAKNVPVHPYVIPDRYSGAYPVPRRWRCMHVFPFHTHALRVYLDSKKKQPFVSFETNGIGRLRTNEQWQIYDCVPSLVKYLFMIFSDA